MTTTARKSSCRELRTASCPKPPSSAMSKLSPVMGTPQAIREWLTSFQAASPASPSPQQGSNLGPMTTAICGRQPQTLFRLSDHDTACLKMCQGYAPTCPWSSETCADLGTRFDDPSSLGLTTLALPIGASESGYWHTPTASDTHKTWERRYPGGKIRQHPIPNLAAEVQIGVPYSQAASRKMWPTPLKRDSRSFKGAARMPNSQGTEPLVVQVGGQLNPNWVEWLMGFPIGWTALKPLGMRKFRLWLRQHGESS